MTENKTQECLCDRGCPNRGQTRVKWTKQTHSQSSNRQPLWRDIKGEAGVRSGCRGSIMSAAHCEHAAGRSVLHAGLSRRRLEADDSLLQSQAYVKPSSGCGGQLLLSYLLCNWMFLCALRPIESSGTPSKGDNQIKPLEQKGGNQINDLSAVKGANSIKGGSAVWQQL